MLRLSQFWNRENRANDAAALAREWERLRPALALAPLAQTPLASLALQLGAPPWPFPGDDEVPAAYAAFDYEALQRTFATREHPSAAAQLVRLLTTAVDHAATLRSGSLLSGTGVEFDNPLRRTLVRLNVPEEFPISLTTLDRETRELCYQEHIRTLGHFALFAPDLARRVSVGDHFRRLLEALARGDERSVAAFLPFRLSSTGLHLIEALGQAVGSDDPAEHTAHAIAWFRPEFNEWLQQARRNPHFIARELVILGDLTLERRILALLEPHVGPGCCEPATDFLARLRRWLGL